MVERLTRAEQTARNRERLLDAAATLMGRAGYRGASVDAIAREAGLTKGAVYSQFRSKEDLLLALMDKRTELSFARLQEIFSGEGSVFDQLADLDRWHRGDPEEGRLWVMIELELMLASARSPKLRQRLLDRQRAARGFIANLIARLYEEEQLEIPLAPREMAVVLTALSDGLLLHWLNDPDAVPGDLFARFLAKTTPRQERKN